MADDFEQELDGIFAHHNARVAQARTDAVEKTSAQENFTLAAADCLSKVIAPALQQMVDALNKRGVAARVIADTDAVRIDIPVSRHARLGQGQGGYPFLRVRADRGTRRIIFERNTIDSRGASALSDMPVAEVNAQLVRAMVVDLVRVLYGPF